jgi:hypothetical protein
VVSAKYEMLKTPAFNAQGSRLIIVVLQLGAMKIICSSSGGAHEKGKTG